MPRSDSIFAAGMNSAVGLLSSTPCESPLGDKRTLVRPAPATEMTRLAAGRTWNTATPDQKERLVAGFRAMLVRTYANAIDVYRGQTMMVEPARVPTSETEATVRNRYVSPGRRPTPVEYSMRKGADGWKIYDIVVDGISLVLTYRSQFEEAARNIGALRAGFSTCEVTCPTSYEEDASSIPFSKAARESTRRPPSSRTDLALWHS